MKLKQNLNIWIILKESDGSIQQSILHCDCSDVEREAWWLWPVIFYSLIISASEIIMIVKFAPFQYTPLRIPLENTPRELGF